MHSWRRKGYQYHQLWKQLPKDLTRHRIVGQFPRSHLYAVGDYFLSLGTNKRRGYHQLTLFQVVMIENVRSKVERTKKKLPGPIITERAYQEILSISLTATTADQIYRGDDHEALRLLRDATQGTPEALLFQSILPQDAQPT